MNVEPTVLLANALTDVARVYAAYDRPEAADKCLEAARSMLMRCAQDFNALEEQSGVTRGPS